MNDNQIIQALKICKLDTTCVTCPYYGKSEAESCFSRLSADALSIIHKQKKQINELTGKHWNEAGQIARYSDELKRFADTDKKVEPVKHGRNISCMHPVDGFLCSECSIKIEGYYKVVYDEDAEDYNHYEYEMKYCPNCGAKITGGEE